ncbi:putative bifunctional diguanylate cyclase/phosphodiesterase [Brevundimonas variabilis]|uniref:Diguanylate cyclase (GGDEF)-like protein n=1 Tax=Brevundimonas variabilis TaxID=74312 RepID=A0A7W9CFY4_9CAUL|nr:GGDEF domain-containing phosphodiesterase [Brevundimonas variabilis]MBB5744801.1 diguanylate cyclase (GGDEF)-like protein [Brevundimonas variabilis]
MALQIITHVKRSSAWKRRLDPAPTEAWARRTMDGVTLVALVTFVSLVVVLVARAASDPDAGHALLIIDAGLIGSGYVLLGQFRKFRNTERASRAHAEYRLRSDPVTELPNAEGFAEAIAFHGREAATSQTEIAILCIKLDRLNEIHARLGEACGDELLRDLSGRLVTSFGSSGVVARVGEDMLAVLHPATPEFKAALVGGEINRLMDLPLITPIGDMAVASTIGVNFPARPITSPQNALRQARLAAAAALTSGAAVAFFEPSLDHTQRLHLDLEVELRQALQSGGLEMVYQPQIDETGVIIGAEALMRWPHPTRGPVSPTLFVPLAETAGLAETLGRYAIERSFADSVLWPGLKIAINVSPIQLKSPNFADMVSSLLVQYGVRASHFEFEITEGVLLRAEPVVLDNLEQLRRMGFQIALDDFGTGYSSLGYLSRLPVDKIKIDRCFVTPLGERKDATMIIRAISDLSIALGVKLLAEGVETRAQLDILRAEGCNQAQGHLIGHPMTPDQITALLELSPEARDAQDRSAA